MLHTGLSLPCSSLSVTLCSGRDRRLRPYPCGLILSTGALPILYLLLSWCRRCARSCTVQVPSEQPCLLDWLAEFLDLLVRTLMSVLEDRGRNNMTLIHAVHSCLSYVLHCFSLTSKVCLNDSLQICWDLWLVSYLECGSKVSLISSGLTKCSDSSVFSTDTLSRSRLSLLPSHILSLEKEE